MKNIHLLPTQNNKTKLATYSYEGSDNIKIGELGLHLDASVGWTNCWNEKELYITSDEKIENKDYVLSDNSTRALYIDGVVITAKILAEGQWKKIILTTDPLLIEHGVQKIDDEFLEWFIKNSNCEVVEVEKLYGKEYVDDQDAYGYDVIKYKPIIPKKYPIGGFAPGNYTCKCVTCEEAFQGDKRAVQCEPCATKEYIFPKANIIDTWLEKYGDPEIMKQVEKEAEELILRAETLIYQQALIEFPKYEQYLQRIGFEAGANWQAERMYSEEEVLEQLNLLHNMRSSKIDTYTDENDCITMKWFKQFKK